MAAALLPSGERPPARGYQSEELRKAPTFLFAMMLVACNSAPAIYLSSDDAPSVAFIVVASLDLVLLFASRLWIVEPGHDGGSSRKRRGQGLLEAGILGLTLLLGALLAYKLVRCAPPSAQQVLLAAVAGATVLGVGGGCAFVLHRRIRSKLPCQEVILPLCARVA